MEKVLGLMLVVALLSMPALFIGWLAMLGLGAIHHEFGVGSAPGYWPCVGLSFIFLFFINLIGRRG